MEYKKISKKIIEDCIFICNRRTEANMTCYYCIYRDTAVCQKLKKANRVEKPGQLYNIKKGDVKI